MSHSPFADKNQLGAAQDRFRSLLPGVKALPTLPSVLFRFMKLVGNPGATLEQLAEFILTDAALLIRVIPLANSSSPGWSLPGGSLRGAIALLGRERLQNVALTMPLLWRDGGLRMGLNLGTVWARSLFCARACEALAQELAVDVRHPAAEKIYLAGLLHDAGYLLFLRNKPEAMRAIFEKGASDADDLLRIESEVMGMDHCQAGLEIARGLNLDPAIGDAIREHHHPSQNSGWIARITGVGSAFCSYQGIDFFSSRTLPRGERTREMEEIIQVLLLDLPSPLAPEDPCRLLAAMESATRPLRRSLGELFM